MALKFGFVGRRSVPFREFRVFKNIELMFNRCVHVCCSKFVDDESVLEKWRAAKLANKRRLAAAAK